MEVVLGIDLGTTNSAMAAMIDSRLTIIPNSNDERTTPSVVSFRTSTDILVGSRAKNFATVNPHVTISSVKRVIGKQAVECENQSRSVSYKLDSDKEGRAVVVLGDQRLLPEEVSAELLRYLKNEAERYLNTSVKKAIITVPAHFDIEQRAATKRAGELAGLDVIRLLEEPYASALVYGLDQKGSSSLILVFDLGGGTLDVSVLELAGGTFMACSLSGDESLGGDDWDARIVDFIARDFLKCYGIDLCANPLSLRLLFIAAERAKRELSTETITHITIPCIASGPEGPLHVDCYLSREEFESMTKDLLQRCRDAIDDVLSKGELFAQDIEEVVMVGGSTRMPAVQVLVSSIFGRVPKATVNPDEVVALGAALQGEVQQNNLKGAWLVDATSLSPAMRAYTQGVIVTSGWWKEPY